MQRTITHRHVVLAFMALVTGWLLALLFGGLLKGGVSASEVVIYGGTAAFGLEFLLTSWPAAWGPGERPDSTT
jgi:hypothetical protein